MTWAIENIPDSDFLFRRIHASILITSQNENEIPPFAFKDNNGLSTDWNKYSTPEDSQHRASEPEKNGVIQIQVALVRQYKNLNVVHVPLPSNRAHSLINGLKSYKKEDQTDIRKRLARSAEWIIKPPSVFK